MAVIGPMFAAALCALPLVGIGRNLATLATT